MVVVGVGPTVERVVIAVEVVLVLEVVEEVGL
jgi:hypothetical protein